MKQSGLGREGASVLRIEAQRRLRGGETVARAVEDGEDVAAQDVVVGVVGLLGDGAVNGRERLAFSLRLVELAGGELVEGEGVVGLLRERFAKGVFGIGVAAEVFELEAAEDFGRHGEMTDGK